MGGKESAFIRVHRRLILLASLLVASLSAGTLPEGDAKQLVATACTTCHTLDPVTAKKRTREEWQSFVANMIQRGAHLTNEQASSVVSYLAFNFGKKDRARDLFEDSCSSCHSLARIRDYSYTKEEWREETKGMISEGTVLTDEELDLLLNYLAKNFGPRPTAEKDPQ
jgi:mono/diheme cytochrome c family protein